MLNAQPKTSVSVFPSVTNVKNMWSFISSPTTTETHSYFKETSWDTFNLYRRQVLKLVVLQAVTPCSTTPIKFARARVKGYKLKNYNINVIDTLQSVFHVTCKLAKL
jgi:hypothetical protein